MTTNNRTIEILARSAFHPYWLLKHKERRIEHVLVAPNSIASGNPMGTVQVPNAKQAWATIAFPHLNENHH